MVDQIRCQKIKQESKGRPCLPWHVREKTNCPNVMLISFVAYLPHSAAVSVPQRKQIATVPGPNRVYYPKDAQMGIE